MINNDALVNVILKMDAFMLKKGQDLALKRELVQGINAFVGDNGLETIYINTVDQVNIPDVFVMPLYDPSFNKFAMDPDITNCCPYGYTVEIHRRCFEKYKAEELVAIIVHHILQNVQSDVAKSRFMGAYAEATRAFKDADLLDAFDDLSHSEVTYMAYLDICMRPFNVPASGDSVVGTDDVLRSIGLADAFDSAFTKMVNDGRLRVDVDDIVARELRQDTKTLKTIFKACLNDEIRHYFTVIKNGMPMLTIQNIMKADKTGTVLGFEARHSYSRKRIIDEHFKDKIVMQEEAILESFLNPRDEIELQYQIDKIITDMRYMEHSDERAALLFRTRNLTMKVMKTKEKLLKQLDKNPNDQNLQHKLEYVNAALDNLDMIRDKIVKTELKPHQIGLVVKYPVGYNY